jgi:TonB family protein
MKCLRLVIATAILIQAFAWPQLPGDVPSDDLRLDRGTIANGTYTNNCFGLSFSIPEGWQVSAIPGVSDGKALHISGGGLGLITIGRRQDKSFGDRIALIATDASKISTLTVQGFVSGSAQRMVNAAPGREMIRDAFAVEYGGRQFFRADYKQPFSNSTMYGAYIYTQFGGYFIGETVMAESPEAVDRAADLLRGLSFQKDQPNPQCVIGPNDGAATGVIGGIISSSPGTGSNSGVPLRVRVSEGVSQGLLTTKVEPEYPDVARKARIQGAVLLKTTIDTNGDVEEVSLISGHPLLAPAAIDAVKHWKYKPYLLNGRAVKVETTVSVVFQLQTN